MIFKSKGLSIIMLFTTCLYVFVTLIVYQMVIKSNNNERILIEDNWHFNHYDEPSSPNQHRQQQRRRNTNHADFPLDRGEGNSIIDDGRRRIRERKQNNIPDFIIDRNDKRGMHNRHHENINNSEREKYMMEYQEEEERKLSDNNNIAYNHYKNHREKYNKIFPDPINNKERLLNLVQALRKNTYVPPANDIPYDIYNCPNTPPKNYPYVWKIYDDIIKHWNPDIIHPLSSHSEKEKMIYQGLCVFDYKTDYNKALNYRNAELPFILKNDPNILSIVERWNHPNYLSELLGSTQPYKSEHSTSNHFMFWRLGRSAIKPSNWKNPTNVDYDITFVDWLKRAKSASNNNIKTTDEHVYFRLNGCKDSYKLQKCLEKNGEGSYFISQEIPFFSPKQSFYIVEPNEFRGINCRFGMNGIIAENHFDGSRNMIILLGGERRYILAHPDQCPNLELHPKGHPSARHSSVDWSNPDFDKHPNFRNALGNEVVLQAGDLLYLPTFWFHYIISLDGVNYQCNARSGITIENSHTIRSCGF